MTRQRWPARIIGLGQGAAGDDGVGLAVLARLREASARPELELVAAADASALLDLLQTPAPVVLVDAVLASPAGQVLALALDDLDATGLRPLSSHGLGAAEAAFLARTLFPGSVSPRVAVVAITIDRADRRATTLSPAVAAAVPRAAEQVLALSGG